MFANLVRIVPLPTYVSYNLCVATIGGLAFSQTGAIVLHLTRRWGLAMLGGAMSVVLGNLDGVLQLLERGRLTGMDVWRSSRVVGRFLDPEAATPRRSTSSPSSARFTAICTRISWSSGQHPADRHPARRAPVPVRRPAAARPLPRAGSLVAGLLRARRHGGDQQLGTSHRGVLGSRCWPVAGSRCSRLLPKARLISACASWSLCLPSLRLVLAVLSVHRVAPARAWGMRLAQSSLVGVPHRLRAHAVSRRRAGGAARHRIAAGRMRGAPPGHRGGGLAIDHAAMAGNAVLPLLAAARSAGTLWVAYRDGRTAPNAPVTS